jgi:hypothetical protein
MKIAISKLILLCAFLAPGFSQADILFIDFNWSTKEIEAAEEAANQRGEKVIVLPVLPDGMRETLRSYWDKVSPGRNQLDNIKKQLSALSNNVKQTKNQIQIERTNSKIESLKKLQSSIVDRDKNINDEYEKLRSKNVKYGEFPHEFELSLAELNSRQIQISSVVISGHHTDVYFGEAGELSSQHIAKQLKLYPEMIMNLQTIYAWVCYSATINEVNSWRDLLPQVDIIGFEVRAPSQLRSGNMQFLKSMMLNEQKAIRASKLENKSELEKILKGVYGLNAISKMHGAACFDKYYHSANQGTSILSNAQLCDAQDLAKLRLQKQQYDLYFSASTEETNDVPANTGASALRSFYSNLRKQQNCKEIADIASLAEKTVNLIFFKSIESNFGIEYAEDLSRLAKILSSLNDPIEIPNFNSSSLATRAEIIQFSHKLSELVNNHKENGLNLYQDGIFVNSMDQLFRRILVDLECIPSVWIESHTTADSLPAPIGQCIEKP